MHVMLGHLFVAPAIEEVAIVEPGEFECALLLASLYFEVVADTQFLAGNGVDVEARHALRHLRLVLQSETDLEDGSGVETALWCELFDESLKRDVLVFVSFEGRAAYLCE